MPCYQIKKNHVRKAFGQCSEYSFGKTKWKYSFTKLFYFLRLHWPATHRRQAFAPPRGVRAKPKALALKKYINTFSPFKLFPGHVLEEEADSQLWPYESFRIFWFRRPWIFTKRYVLQEVRRVWRTKAAAEHFWYESSLIFRNSGPRSASRTTKIVLRGFRDFAVSHFSYESTMIFATFQSRKPLNATKIGGREASFFAHFCPTRTHFSQTERFPLSQRPSRWKTVFLKCGIRTGA